MGGDFNARNPTEYFSYGAGGRCYGKKVVSRSTFCFAYFLSCKRPLKEEMKYDGQIMRIKSRLKLKLPSDILSSWQEYYILWESIPFLILSAI